MARYSFHINKGWNGKEVDVAAMPTIFAEDATRESKAESIKKCGAVGRQAATGAGFKLGK